jgi:AcrR family transcriptional regulator
MPRKKDSKATIERILNSALKLFSEKEFDKTNMQDIVNDSGMSKGSIFYHFESKEEIFEAAMGKQFEHMKQSCVQLFAEAEGRTAREKLRLLIHHSLDINLIEMDKKNLTDDFKIYVSHISNINKSPHLILAQMQHQLKH